MRAVHILCLLLACLIIEPPAAHSQQKIVYLGNQGRIDGLRITSPQVRKPLIAKGRSRVRAGSTRSSSRISAAPQKLAVVAGVDNTRKDNGLPGLPGLPSGLIAIVEGSPPEGALASFSARPPVPANALVAAKPPASPVASGPSSVSGPVALIAGTADTTDPTAHGLFLPFEAGVGAAAFSRGKDTLVVFDAARPLDLSMVQNDPVGAYSTIELLPEATVLRLSGPHAKNLVLSRLPAGWLIQSHESKPNRSIEATMDGAVLRLPVDEPGRTVVVPDPQTGGNLLVGTVLSGGAAVHVRRRGIAEVIEQTILGVVIDPLSDRLELHSARKAFLLSGFGNEALDVVSVMPGVMSGGGAAIPRVMSLGAGSSEALQRRFKDAMAAAAKAPPGSRFLPRLLAAQDALALGDAAQAAAIVHVALADDAREAAAPLPQLVVAASNLLDRHSDATALLDDTHMTGNGEIGLWRAVKLAERNPASSEAARLFAVNMPLLQSYPDPLRKSLLPIAAVSLARSGSDAQAAMIDHLPADKALNFARAVLAERRGQTSTALARLDQLAFDQDLRVGDEAVEEAVEIRRRLPSADPAKLADVLETHLLDARIGGHEISSRFNLADLLIQSKQYHKALQLLRETASSYPAEAAEVRRRVGDLLRHLAGAPLPAHDEEALDQAAMIEANADMLPDGADGGRVSLFLATRLMELDLPERALPIVRDMMHAAAPGTEKAELGLRLAALDFQENDLDGVQTALHESDPGNLPADRVAPRLIITARALAGGGQLEQALAMIAPLKTTEALDLKATLLSRRGDWAGTTDVLLSLAGEGQPPAGKFDDAGQDMLLRLASAASHTKDRARIVHVRGFGIGRFSDPGKEALFRLLTSDPTSDDAETTKIPSEAASFHHASDILNSISR